MKLTRLLVTDTRGQGQTIKNTEGELNAAMIDLQKRGCTILETPKLLHVDTDRKVCVIFYDDPSFKE